MWMKYTTHDCAIDVTELSFSLFLKVALDIRTRLRYLMAMRTGSRYRIHISFGQMLVDSLLKLKVLSMCIARGKYDKRWRSMLL